ncbi:MAG: RNA polymerase sigma factor [Anaeroplasmataceae bacterium]
MNLDDIIEELRVCNYEHFDIFYNETKKNVFFSIASIIKDRSLIDDLMQDTYIKFLENIDKYKSKTSVNAFLSTIAHNIAINYYNREKRLVHDEMIIDVVEDKTKDPYSEIEAIEMLKDLEDSEREIVVLHVLNELKFREIADIVDKPIGTVLWIYNKAISKLKKKYK